MNDIGHTVEKFVKSWIEKLKCGPVLVEDWDTEARKILDELRAATSASTDVASLKLATDAWTRLSHLLKLLLQCDQDVHFPGFVQQACTSWWDSVTERQIKLRCSAADAYRGMAAYIAAQLAFRRRDWGAALRWASLGYIVDKLGESKAGGGNEVTLRFGLAVPKEALNLLDKLVGNGSKSSSLERFPEWLLADALDYPSAISLVAPSTLYSHHPSSSFVKAAAEQVFSDKGTSGEKGKRLEMFTAFLVRDLCKTLLNGRHEGKSEEYANDDQCTDGTSRQPDDRHAGQ